MFALAISVAGDNVDPCSRTESTVTVRTPEGTRGDAGRAVEAANRAAPAWAARSAFERAAAMERVAAVIDERRDDLARTLTLDQGKPLRAEARARGRAPRTGPAVGCRCHPG